jgi:hypothetical protein
MSGPDVIMLSYDEPLADVLHARLELMLRPQEALQVRSLKNLLVRERGRGHSDQLSGLHFKKWHLATIRRRRFPSGGGLGWWRHRGRPAGNRAWPEGA